MNRRHVLRGVGTAAVLLAGCAGGDAGDGGAGTGTATDTGTATEATTATPAASTDLSLASSAFDEGAAIPTRHTCDGANASPRLTVAGVPDTATALALVVDDPDAPRERPFVHWLLWNVPAKVSELPAGLSREETLPSLGGARQGTNDAGRVGYSGPCPPTGDGPHTYRFTLSALDTTLTLAAGAERPALDDALAEATIASVTLSGTYERA